MVILVDFDSTCVTHAFPLVGKNIGAAPVLRELVKHGHSLILWTMRSNSSEVPVGIDESKVKYIVGNHLDVAVDWFNRNQIPLWGINENPEQRGWTTSPKAFGQYLIDDTAVGCPLITIEEEKPFVDWIKMYKLLVDLKILDWVKPSIVNEIIKNRNL